MGILSTGRPLTWSEIASVVRSILKKHALNDLINILNKHRRRNDNFLWGDEVSYSFLFRENFRRKRNSFLN